MLDHYESPEQFLCALAQILQVSWNCTGRDEPNFYKKNNKSLISVLMVVISYSSIHLVSPHKGIRILKVIIRTSG